MEIGEVKRIAEKTIKNVKTIGIALTSCTVPAKGSPTFHLEDDEIEFGIGIHGEPGIKRQKIESADDHAKKMCDRLIGELELDDNCECALIVNGMGGTPLMELYLFNNSVSKYLEEKRIRIHRTFVAIYDFAGYGGGFRHFAEAGQ